MDIKDIELMLSSAIYKAQINVIKYLAASFVIGLIIVAIFGHFSDKDSTDSPTTRSGMELHIDNLTGCHYLSRKGGITPRLSVSGKQYGCHANG